jgi:quercetin dioxygenase-like cupin family protein
MVDQIEVMIAAVVIAIGAMMFLAGKIGAFVDEHPTVKMLALSFLVLIGATLLAEGFNIHISKAAIYGPIAFAIGVEVLNLIYRSRAEKRAGKKHDPVHLRAEYTDDAAPTEQPPTPTVRAFTIAAESGENIQFGDRQIVITPAVKASEGGRLSAYSATFGRGEKADLPAPYEEVWIVIDGQLRIRSDDTVTTARTGDYLHIPDNTPGQVEATEKTVLVCVSVPGH